jgi:hypothetical protein
MSSLFDELVVAAAAVVDPSRSPLEQLRAAAQRDLRACTIESIPGPLWADLCRAGECSTPALAALFEREHHREALKELVPLLDPRTLFAIASRTPVARADESADRGVLFQSVMRLATTGDVDAAIELTLRVEWLADNTHLLLALCERAGPARSRPLVARAMALASRETASSVTQDLCAMVACVDDRAQQSALLSLCEQRVAETKPSQMDLGENAWGWLALAFARLARPDDVHRCLERATSSVRDEECDRLSDARYAVECALALDANEHRGPRLALARRALAAMKEHPSEVWEWLVESLVKIAPSLEAEARVLRPTDSEPPEPDAEEPPLSAIEDARQCAAAGRERWTTRTLIAIRQAISATNPASDDGEPDERPAMTARAQSDARAAYARWMRSEFDRSAKGWIATRDGEPLTFEAQCQVLGALSHEEIEALLEHACPDRSNRSHLLYLVAEAARGCARNGDVPAMRAHVETIENCGTTPALVFELCALLPDGMKQDELRRAFANALDSPDVPLAQRYGLSALMTEAAFASDELRAIAIEAIDQIDSPTLTMECLGRLLRCGRHPRADDSLCVARARQLAGTLKDDALASAPLTDDLERALCALDEEQARAAWARWANGAAPRLSWRLALRVFGRALIEQFAREIGGERALEPTEADRW